MKVVILAGGFGTRISEESALKPKPMVEIGGMPILWHIMKMYSHHGFNEFIICAGYKQDVIKEFFANYFIHSSDITFDFLNHNEMQVHAKNAEPWKVTVIDTGLNTMTGGRVKRIKEYLNNERFLLTYGDGVSDTDISESIEYHKKHGKMCTITAIQPAGRFGVMDISADNKIKSFRQKDQEDSAWINGGFMVVEPEFVDYIEGDQTVLEAAPFERLVEQGQMMCYKHHGFWQCMDTVRDKHLLENHWSSGKAPWKKW